MAVTSRVTKRRAETRGRLLAAAFAVVRDQGLGQVRIEDVCAAAGFTRGAFYSQFASLDELFLALYDDQVGGAIDRIVADLTVGPGELAAQVQRLVDTLPLERDWVLVHAEFRLRAARDPLVAARLQAQREHLLAAVAHELQPVAERLALPEKLATVADAALAVATVYDGVAAAIVGGADPATARSWLVRLLTALLDPGPRG